MTTLFPKAAQSTGLDLELEAIGDDVLNTLHLKLIAQPDVATVIDTERKSAREQIGEAVSLENWLN